MIWHTELLWELHSMIKLLIGASSTPYRSCPVARSCRGSNLTNQAHLIRGSAQLMTEALKGCSCAVATFTSSIVFLICRTSRLLVQRGPRGLCRRQGLQSPGAFCHTPIP